jgi:hypothetical protein
MIIMAGAKKLRAKIPLFQPWCEPGPAKAAQKPAAALRQRQKMGRDGPSNLHMCFQLFDNPCTTAKGRLYMYSFHLKNTCTGIVLAGQQTLLPPPTQETIRSTLVVANTACRLTKELSISGAAVSAAAPKVVPLPALLRR